MSWHSGAETKNNKIHYTVPTAPPQNVSLTKVSALSVTLTWEPPATEHQNGLITGYIVTIYRGSEQEQRKETADNSTTIDSLSGNTHYKLYLAARTDIGIGPNSDAVDFKTKIYGMVTDLHYNIHYLEWEISKSEIPLLSSSSLYCN